MLLFFQKLGSMFQSNQPDVVSRSLVGQCLYLIVEAGPTHIQQVAEHVDVEAWVVHIVFDALFDSIACPAEVSVIKRSDADHILKSTQLTSFIPSY